MVNSSIMLLWVVTFCTFCTSLEYFVGFQNGHATSSACCKTVRETFLFYLEVWSIEMVWLSAQYHYSNVLGAGQSFGEAFEDFINIPVKILTDQPLITVYFVLLYINDSSLLLISTCKLSTNSLDQFSFI